MSCIMELVNPSCFLYTGKKFFLAELVLCIVLVKSGGYLDYLNIVY